MVKVGIPEYSTSKMHTVSDKWHDRIQIRGMIYCIIYITMHTTTRGANKDNKQ